MSVQFDFSGIKSSVMEWLKVHRHGVMGDGDFSSCAGYFSSLRGDFQVGFSRPDGD